MKETHFNNSFRWPEGKRMTVALTFDFQGAEGVPVPKSGNQDYEAYTQAEYGPHTGIWRLLDILAEENVKATFFTCGAIGERYPDAVKAIAAAGHEVAGHGYHHEIARDLKPAEETDVMERTTARLKSVVGTPPRGWRSCTQSPNTLELLIEQGYLYNSNSFSHDLPFLYENNGKALVELPRQPFGDGTLFGHRHGEYGNPFHGLETWKAYFDELYHEAAARPGYIPFTLHPYIIGRPGRTLALRGIIQHMKKAGNIWFATGEELADWCVNDIFKGEAKELARSSGR